MDSFACMEMISQNEADLLLLDPGMGYTAGEYFTMVPLAAEKYDTGAHASRLRLFHSPICNALLHFAALSAVMVGKQHFRVGSSGRSERARLLRRGRREARQQRLRRGVTGRKESVPHRLVSRAAS